MTDEDLKAYAEHLILSHATDVEWLSIHEMAEDYFNGEELADGDANEVQQFINTATVTVSWSK